MPSAITRRPSDRPRFSTALTFTNGERLVEQIARYLALFFDLLDHARTQHLKQAGDDDHDRRLGFLNVARQLLEAFGIIDFRADPDGQELPAVPPRCR